MGLEERLADIESTVSSLPLRDFRRRRVLSSRNIKQIAQQVIDAQPSVSSGSLVYVDEVVLADQSTGTENAWTTLPVSLPNGATTPLIQFEIESTSNTDVAEMFWRSDAVYLPVVVRACIVDQDEDDAQPRIVYEIPLTNGAFDYNMTVSAGSPNWVIRLQGYRT